ncbi:MAG TPA: PepSY domain-containing protein [Caulobacteraceae bacterium]|nr:PepSY domain-containing protein [Caulobacteraceae bacterium]
MKRTAVLFAILALGAGLPGIADAQGRGRDRDEAPRASMRDRDRDRDRSDSLGSNWQPQQDEARSGVRQGRMIPLESIAPRLNRRAPGRLLDAGIESRGGLPVYRVRWQAADGRRIDYLVDAATGMIIGADGE